MKTIRVLVPLGIARKLTEADQPHGILEEIPVNGLRMPGWSN